jgi:hypothetical protein
VCFKQFIKTYAAGDELMCDLSIMARFIESGSKRNGPPPAMNLKESATGGGLQPAALFFGLT